jgi:hypothetical protein
MGYICGNCERRHNRLSLTPSNSLATRFYAGQRPFSLRLCVVLSVDSFTVFSPKIATFLAE